MVQPKRGSNMPSVKKGESQNKYMNRCVPIVKAEGKTQSQAVGQCMGMYKQKWSSKNKKRK